MEFTNKRPIATEYEESPQHVDEIQPTDAELSTTVHVIYSGYRQNSAFGYINMYFFFHLPEPQS